MIPALYNSTATTKIADLKNCIKGIAIEERNGMCEIEIIYPLFSEAWEQLLRGNIIIADLNDTIKAQQFRIYKISKPLSGKIIVYARHIFFDTSRDFIEEINIEKQSCEYCLNQIFRHSQFSQKFKGFSDIIAAQNYNIKSINPLSAIGGSKGSILDTFGTGAELKLDNYNIYILNKRGHDNGVTIEYSKNLTGFNLDIDDSNLITRIKPFAKYNKNNEEEFIFSNPRYIDSPLIDEYETPFIKEIDFSDKFDDNEIPTASKLKLLAERYFIENKCDQVKTTFKVEFIPLSKCLGYEGIQDKISLCDIVTIKDYRYKINTKAKVIKTQYDFLSERYNSIELGEPKVTLSDLINNNNSVGPQGPQGKPGKDGKDGEEFPDTLPHIPVLEADLNGFASVNLSWSFENKVYYSYQLFASKDGNSKPNMFDLIFEGQGSSFLHQVKPDETWYYWVRGLNSYGRATELSEKVEVTTLKKDNFEEYFSSLAVENLVANIFSVDYMKAGIIKGNWIDAKQLSVTDGNGKRTLDIDSFGRVRLNVTELSILSKTVETEESSTLKINNAKAEAINSATADTNKKISNLQVGGRNYTLGTEVPKIITGENRTNQTYNIGKTNGDILKGKKVTISYDWSVEGTTISGTFKIQTGGEMYYQGGNTNTVSSSNKSGKEVFTCTLPTNRGTFQAMYVRMDNFNGTLTIKNFKMELGDKATDYTPAPEDISKEILDITTEKVNQAKADIKVTTDAITQKVNKVESITTTLNGNITNHESRIASAEKKITSEAIINTVSATVNQAKNDAISVSSKEISKVEQKVNEVTYSFQDISNENLLDNSSFEKEETYTKNHPFILDRLNGGVDGYPSSIDGGKYLRIYTNGSDSYFVKNTSIKIKPNTAYTISFYYCCTQSVNGSNYVFINGNPVNIPTRYIGDRAWHRISYTFRTNANIDGITAVRFGLVAQGTAWLLLDNIQIEEGEFLTKWKAKKDELCTGISFIDAGGIGVRHEDGSFTKMTANGFKRYIASSGYDYHYLTYTGKTQKLNINPVTIQLPNDFKGKDFKVSLSLEEIANPAGWFVQSVQLLVGNINKANGTFQILGGSQSQFHDGTQGTMKPTTISYTVTA